MNNKSGVVVDAIDTDIFCAAEICFIFDVIRHQIAAQAKTLRPHSCIETWRDATSVALDHMAFMCCIVHAYFYKP